MLKAIRQYIEGQGIECSLKQAELLYSYTKELMEWNKKINLVGSKDIEGALYNQVLPSIFFLKEMGLDKREDIIDLGTGAGIPGIPLKIISPCNRLTLVERSSKKGLFVRHIIRYLDLKDIHVLTKDIKMVLQEAGLKHQFDKAVSRAMGNFGLLLTASSQFLKQNGSLIVQKGTGFFKGTYVSSTLPFGSKIQEGYLMLIKEAKMELVSTKEITLPLIPKGKVEETYVPLTMSNIILMVIRNVSRET